jgi:hypothetical protein
MGGSGSPPPVQQRVKAPIRPLVDQRFAAKKLDSTGSLSKTFINKYQTIAFLHQVVYAISEYPS